MKTIKYIAASLAIIAAASCQDNIAPENEQETTTIFKASLELETKITLGEKEADGSVPTYWDDTENISIFDDDGTNIKFTGTAEKSNSIEFSSTKGSFSENQAYYAAYPYHSGHKFSDGTITYCYGNVNQIPDENNLPCEMQDNTDRKLTVACAYGTKDNLSFHHIYALVKFTITREDVTCVTLVNAASDKIATDKNFTISYSDGKFTPTFIDKGTVYLYKDKSKNSTFLPGTYYMAVRPCELKVKIKLNNGEYKIGKSAVTLKAGDILNIGTLE